MSITTFMAVVPQDAVGEATEPERRPEVTNDRKEKDENVPKFEQSNEGGPPGLSPQAEAGHAPVRGRLQDAPRGALLGDLSMPVMSRREAILFALPLLAAPATAQLAASAAEPSPLALKGYDTVAYFTLGRATRGLPEFEFEWDELRYRFVSAEHRDTFTGDPVRYAPQFANFCAMALTRGEMVEADPESWLITNGKLYVFGEAVGPDRFRKDLPRNVERAKQNRRIIEKR